MYRQAENRHHKTNPSSSHNRISVSTDSSSDYNAGEFSPTNESSIQSSSSFGPHYGGNIFDMDEISFNRAPGTGFMLDSPAANQSDQLPPGRLRRETPGHVSGEHRVYFPTEFIEGFRAGHVEVNLPGGTQELIRPSDSVDLKFRFPSIQDLNLNGDETNPVSNLGSEYYSSRFGNWHNRPVNDNFSLPSNFPRMEPRHSPFNNSLALNGIISHAEDRVTEFSVGLMTSNEATAENITTNTIMSLDSGLLSNSNLDAFSSTQHSAFLMDQGTSPGGYEDSASNLNDALSCSSSSRFKNCFS